VDIYLPLLRHAVIASFTTSFMRAVTNLSIAVFLVTPGNMVGTFAILMAINNGNWGTAAALTVALLVVSLAILAIGQTLLGRGLRPLPSG
jgi:iron(III) transport system permease protein